MNFHQLDIKYYLDMFKFDCVAQSVFDYTKKGMPDEKRIYYYTIKNNYRLEINNLLFIVDYINLFNSYLTLRIKEKLYEPFCLVAYKDIKTITIKEI